MNYRLMKMTLNRVKQMLIKGIYFQNRKVTFLRLEATYYQELHSKEGFEEFSFKDFCDYFENITKFNLTEYLDKHERGLK